MKLSVVFRFRPGTLTLTPNQANKKKKTLRDLKRSVEVVRAKMLTVSFNLTVKDLTTLCRWKKTKEDGKMPTKRSDLEALWRKIENRSSPHVSPENSDAEEDDHDAMDIDAILSEDELEDEVVVPPSDVGWIFEDGEEGDVDDWEHSFDGEDDDDDDQHNNQGVVGV